MSDKGDRQGRALADNATASTESAPGIGRLLEMREAAMREYRRLDEELFRAMKRRIADGAAPASTEGSGS
jgi:hypothetical protein